MSTDQTSRLAELLDSRSDTRDMLSTRPNLAHACLLLGRGETELARRELALGIKDEALDSRVIGRCIESELLRLEGAPLAAWESALETAREHRFHSAAALYLRQLFVLSTKLSTSSPDPAAIDVPVPPASQTPVEPFEGADDAPPSELDQEPQRPFPKTWDGLADDPGITGIHLSCPEGVSIAGCDLAPLSPLLNWLSEDLFPRTGMGHLQHAVFEGEDRLLHHWNGSARLTALLDAGPQAQLLAARLGKAHREEEVP